MLRKQLKIEEKNMDFVFEIVNIQFNQLGRFRLMLTVENPLLTSSAAEVQLRVKDGEILHESSVATDTIEQVSLDEIYTFSSSKFVFTLPKGNLFKPKGSVNVLWHIWRPLL